MTTLPPALAPYAPALAALAAVLLDRLFGEARRWHPLVGFGRLATAIERRLNREACPGDSRGKDDDGVAGRPTSRFLREAGTGVGAETVGGVACAGAGGPDEAAGGPGERPASRPEPAAWQGIDAPAGRDGRATGNGRIAAGLLAWCLAVLPWVALATVLWSGAPFAVDVALLYFALGARSLAEHAEAVAGPLAAGRLDEARWRVGRMVSRDTAALDASGVARAGMESVLENGNDAVFGALFWFALLGGPGALLFRLANTLDAMWGYRNERYLLFGRAAARLDDALNWPAARLTALTYALLGRTRQALACWRTQAGAWESPNAGPVMAAGAGSLGVSLGGAAIYHGRTEERPALGRGPAPGAADLGRAIRLVRHGIWLWLAAFFTIGFLHA